MLVFIPVKIIFILFLLQNKAILIEKHENCDSAIAKYTGCGMMPNMSFDMTDEEARAAWEPVVESQR